MRIKYFSFHNFKCWTPYLLCEVSLFYTWMARMGSKYALSCKHCLFGPYNRYIMHILHTLHVSRTLLMKSLNLWTSSRRLIHCGMSAETTPLFLNISLLPFLLLCLTFKSYLFLAFLYRSLLFNDK